MVYSEYTWDYVKELLKIDIQQTETDTHYIFTVYIPCFDEGGYIEICKKDFYFKWVFYDASPEDEIIDIVIKAFNLEAWLSTKIIRKKIN